ncbi:hypothetical protein SDRG_10819 [Saprolegnia diclina VS20]|uniref:FYVE-type domain-containing protein n=1 Tax=Saprolegnia diclina (strain VS20) TaxID=1156394 RepID=T0Q1D7_SAPDV|nr:hypothetical protein SDRG_10819 [Saprolegnia diclina VS20]EQC31654.1 hypothetical protein SDRG_10819 [Saprolegnia diclina VS20]|eukprot:XP_008615053.1 hypothetical protein SDRG_10819 [Saprolegnia diclina VS20]
MRPRILLSCLPLALSSRRHAHPSCFRAWREFVPVEATSLIRGGPTTDALMIDASWSPAEAVRLSPRETLSLLAEGATAFHALLRHSKLAANNSRIYQPKASCKQYYMGYATTAIQESFVSVRSRYKSLMHHRDEYCRVFALEDTRILCVLQSPGVALGPWHKPSSALVLLRWMARTPTRTGSRARDFLVLEYMDTIVDAKGERSYARVWHSVTHAAFPPQYGYERQVLLHSGDVVRESPAGRPVSCRRLMFLDVHSIKSALPKFVFAHLVQRQVRNQYACHLDRLLWDHMSPDDAFTDNVSDAILALGGEDDDVHMLECTIKYVATECDLCAKGFHLFRPKYSCLECDKTVCRRCSRGFMQGTLRNRTIADMEARRVCFRCCIEKRAGASRTA